MDLQNAQKVVDNWINNHGVRYFNELTNMAQLTEEVGEVARIISRRYGEQSEKESDKNKDLGEELARREHTKSYLSSGWSFKPNGEYVLRASKHDTGLKQWKNLTPF